MGRIPHERLQIEPDREVGLGVELAARRHGTSEAVWITMWDDFTETRRRLTLTDMRDMRDWLAAEIEAQGVRTK